MKSKRLLEGLKDIGEMLYYQSFLYILKVIYSNLISKYHDNFFISYFGIEKTQELIAIKYYSSILQREIKVYIKDYDMCLTSKIVYQKPYNNYLYQPIDKIT